MSSKITEAIKQLNHSINSLNDAVPSMEEAATEKEKQVETLREKYFITHPEILSGMWNLDISLTQQHTRLTGWKYDYNGTLCEGDDSGNFLVSGIALKDDEYSTTVEIPYSDEEHLTCASPRIQLTATHGDIRIDFYNIESAEVFHFIKEHNITIEVPNMDKSILGFQQRIDELNDAKQAVIDAGLIKAEPEPPPTREQLFHKAVVDDTLPVEESDGIQFNAEQVSDLHKHIGVSYETLTEILTWVRTHAGSVKFESLLDSLERLQTDLDDIAVEIGDLDTKDEPLDVGMAGSIYWNLIQAAMYHLDGTVNYIEAQDIPLFAEVHYRLKKLVEILQRCSDEFGDTYLGGNYDNE